MELKFGTVDRICASATLNNGELLIDLSEIELFRPFALVYLGMFLRYHNGKGQVCSVVLPKYPEARSYLATQNFWKRFNFSADTVEKENLNKLTISTSLNNIADIVQSATIAEDIEKQVKDVLLSNQINISIPEVSNIVVELVDNFSRHSKKMLAAFHMQYYPSHKELALAIADCGIGIRASLSTNPKYKYLSSLPHHVAAVKAFEAGIGCTPEGGMGLTDVMDSVNTLNGRLFLSTGDEFVIMDKEGVKYGSMAYDLTGVQIGLSLPVGT
jgi:hypothetical protein